MAYSVSELVSNLNTAIRLSNALSKIEIEGEIIGYKGPNRKGHIYFDLRDEDSIIKCMMFASKCTLEYKEIFRDGVKVTLYGSLNYHPSFGLSFVFERVAETGEGVRKRELLKLRRELEELGMFDEMFKKPIPRFPMTIGLITTHTGTSVGDVAVNARKNNPYISVIVASAQMEGEGAAASVVSAIKLMDAYAPDVIILSRGGGSEDSLWTFNDRDVAQAVFDCNTPIVSAVGHTRDKTLVDDIADKYENTPTGAALVVTQETANLLNYLENAPEELTIMMNRHISSCRKTLKNSLEAIRYNSPENKLARKKKELEDQKLLLSSLMESKISGYKNALSMYTIQLPPLMDASLKKAVKTRDVYAGSLEGLSPVGRLKSGFSYASDKAGKNIRSIKGVKSGDEISIRVTDGEIISTVKDTKKV